MPVSSNSIVNSLASVMQAGAVGQDHSSIETYVGKIVTTYEDANGNVTSVDLLVPGQPNQITNVPNYSGINVGADDSVTLNFNKGNKHSPQVIQAGGANAATAAANAASQLSNSQLPSMITNDLAGAALVLAAASAVVPGGYILHAGANVTLAFVAPEPGSGGATTPGSIIISAIFARLTSLPNPATTVLADGTVVVLTTSYGTFLGLYQLIRSVPEWQLISGGGGGGAIYPSTVLSGVNGSNTSFTLPYMPVNGLAVYADHFRMVPTTDYTWTPGSTSLSMVVAPVSSLVVDIF